MEDLRFWLQSTMKRIYPGSEAADSPALGLISGRNDQVSFQACIRNGSLLPVTAQITVECPGELSVMVRRVGYIPVRHLTPDTDAEHLEGVGHVPGLVPDPLFPENSVVVGPFESHAFWITVGVPAAVEPGIRDIKVGFSIGEETIWPLNISLDVRPLVIKPTRFPVTHWFYADSICDWYKVEPFEERFWKLLRPYVKDVVAHGVSSLYVPIFTPPTDGIKRPTQLLRVTTPSEGKYEFDFTDVKRWVDIGKESGAQYFEWTHWFWQWGVKYALRVYRSNVDPESLLWPHETSATSDVYREFLSQFLPQFKAFLEQEGILANSFFHVSDEPHGDEHLANYRSARLMLRELAPWMKVMDALSEVSYGKEGLTDMPIPSISVAHEYAESGISAWVYYCCGPRGKFLNRFMDTPLAKIRMHGWLFRRLNAHGFLHWGYNYWYKAQTQRLIDPFTEAASDNWPNFSYGDPFVVYPGEDGPVDSIRWEVFAESLREYALLETAGISSDDPILADIKGYDDFPFSEEWVENARRRILV